VPLATVLSTVKHLAPTVRAMVLVQLYTGMRPGEVRILRPCDLDRSTCPWVYLPPKHKGQHLGRSRKVLIGPQARAILAPILARRDPGTWVFGTAGTKGGGKRTGYYRRDAYTRAVARACQRAGVEHWSPLQLRHTAATLFRSKDGLEASQVLLGHARADVTQIYAEPREELARQVIERLG
jgi:integrase